MGTVNGWCVVGGGGGRVRGDEIFVNGEDGEKLMSTLSPPLLENVDRRSCSDVSRELIQIFNNPYQKS